MSHTEGPGPGPVRATVHGSRLRVGSASGATLTLTQCDATTCGAASVLAARLLRGLGPVLPTPSPGPGALPARDLAAGLARLQRALKTRMNRDGLGALPWPGRLGSAPWSVAAAMTRAWQQAGTVYELRPVRDEGQRWQRAVERVRAHLSQGLPVILLTGGPLLPRGGDRAGSAARRALALAPAVPRHYVLAVPWTLIGSRDPGAGRAHVYEPGSGTVRVLDLLALRDRRGTGPRELGSWPRVLALIAPCPVDDA
ncbi:hypothetical protein [Actinomyces howellii]|uniref:Uncharacterized protein n=1 Tax=Actinomyces howellii TaxID=52771 RepID=A0A3S4RF01_9ACTO|nr:hypothetical protein [Actinomyces howellii]VEG27261.1 Uncharacterised protein [Actinomyces howellii]